MKAWQITSPSGLEELHLVDTHPPAVGDQDVLINVEAVALNPFDFKLANWGYATWDYPKTLGTDFAGTVTECGDAVKHFTVGDRVCCFADPRRAGAFAEKIAVNQHHLARIPDGVDFGSAAAITSSGLTAWQTLHKKLCLSAGSSLVINGAAGGVGGYLIQLAKAAGLTVIGIDAKKHLDRMLSLGADITLDYRNDNIAMAVMQATEGAMADALIDCVASKKAGAFSSLLKYNGQMVSISESLSEIPVIAAMRGLTIHEIALSGVYAHGLKEHVEEMIDNCHSLLTELASGKIQANIGSTLSFEQLKDGLQHLQLGQCYGKIIVNVN